MSESIVPGRLADTLDGTEWLGFTRGTSNREFPFKAQLLPVAGTVSASKMLVADANKDLTGLRHFTITGNFVTGSTTLSEAELGVLDSAAATNAGTGKAMITGTSGALTVAGALTASSTIAATGAITPTGGVAAAGGFTARPSNIHTGGISAQVSTDGTDATPSVSETYYAAVFIPANMSVTGARVFLGSATEGNIKVGLFNSAGAVVATSASTDASGATVDAYFQVAFTAPYAAVGPATYYVGLLNDNTGNRFNAHAFGAFPAGKTTGETYATGFTTIASPATTFTADLGPMATLY